MHGKYNIPLNSWELAPQYGLLDLDLDLDTLLLLLPPPKGRPNCGNADGRLVEFGIQQALWYLEIFAEVGEAGTEADVGDRVLPPPPPPLPKYPPTLLVDDLRDGDRHGDVILLEVELLQSLQGLRSWRFLSSPVIINQNARRMLLGLVKHY